MMTTRRLTAGFLTIAVLSGGLTVGSAATASARQSESPIQTYTAMKCWKDHDENACKGHLTGKKMSKNVKECLVKGGLIGAASVVVGRINKTEASKLAKIAVTNGGAACLAAVS
ncbi:hypothetical protein [Streptomyces syringium]|uniref:hypothetical protein n=1 Tax=Streptomyces syringium TaxID=76729 RepID=UPI003455A18C